MSQTCVSDNQIPSFYKDIEEETGEDERSEIFSSKQEEESSLMEDWTITQEEISNRQEEQTKPDMLRHYIRP